MGRLGIKWWGLGFGGKVLDKVGKPPHKKSRPDCSERLLYSILYPEQRSGIHLSLNHHFSEHTHVRVREEAEGFQPLRCCHRHIGHTSCRIAARIRTVRVT